MNARAAGIVVAAGACSAWAQPASVVNSPHNLSASGPGLIRAVTEEQVCIFCHVPHNASPIQPLWNRSSPIDAYAIYSSRALEAQPGQPTGTSKMCLSCHDGTIALGSVLSRSTPITMVGGTAVIPLGRSNIGTDLRDDHPISFRYDSALAALDRKIKDPSLLPPEIRLDANAELQCTSCHDAHNDSRGDFLVASNVQSQLCVSCHQVGTTTISGHGSCDTCHQPHTAPSGPYLLRRQTITDTCLACHNGTIPGAPNIATDLKKASIHDTHSPVDPPEPLINHTSCVDCHEPHTMTADAGQAPAVHGNFGRVAGVSASGSPLAAASSEYEACFRCHAEGNAGQAWVARRIVQNNTRLEFSPSAVSYHPVEAPGRNPDVPSLRPGWTTSSVMYCSSCHGSDTGRSAGGADPDGVHGSNIAPLLSARYETANFTSESTQAYALCYKCHERGSILSDQSFKGHKQHIVDQRAPCAACHEAHGIASGQGSIAGNTNLINFASGTVFPDGATGRLEFRDTGLFSGECFLRCHGVNHSPSRYP
jgi:predicted CXXCH cytochrome family protein